MSGRGGGKIDPDKNIHKLSITPYARVSINMERKVALDDVEKAKKLDKMPGFKISWRLENYKGDNPYYNDEQDGSRWCQAKDQLTQLDLFFLSLSLFLSFFPFFLSSFLFLSFLSFSFSFSFL